MRATQDTLISNLPPNSDLPDDVHDMCDEWRRLNSRAAELRGQVRALHDEIRAAEQADAEALHRAALAGGDLPNVDSSAPIRAKLARVDEAVTAVENERERVAREVLIALRADHVRARLVKDIQARIGDAAKAYMDAITEAEQRVRDAHARLVAATNNISVVRALDTGKRVTILPDGGIELPMFARAKAATQAAVDAAAKLSDRAQPPIRRVRLKTNGRIVSLSALNAAQALGRGEVEAFVDGWSPEEPIRPMSASVTSLTFPEARTKFAG